MKGCCLVLLPFLASLWIQSSEAQLSQTYYDSSCPNVEAIVRSTIITAMNQSNLVGPSTLRLFAHDCFVQGCDASIILESTPTNSAERDAPENKSLQQAAFDTVNRVKNAVEGQCPGVVSCADIVVMAARDVTNLMGGPSWTVPLGRRDSLASHASSVTGHLPGANMDVNALTAVFAAMKLTQYDMVVLSGAHTVGFAHCNEFVGRLYNYNNVLNATDPSISSGYAQTLKSVCPEGSYSSSAAQAFDPLSVAKFDSMYYQDLQEGQGLLASDQVIYVDNRTNSQVTTYANNQAQFFSDFVTSMIAMSRVGVLTGADGEIRLNCSVVNSPNPPTGSVSSPPPAVDVSPVPPEVTPPSSPPPAPIVTPSPPPSSAPNVTPSTPPPPVPIVTPPTPAAPIVTSSPPPAAPVVTPSPPAIPVVTSSPPPPLPTVAPPAGR